VAVTLAPPVAAATVNEAPAATPETSVVLAQDIAQATAQLRAGHRQETTALQQAVDRVTAIVGRPSFVAALAAAVVVWIGSNLLAARLGLKAPDTPPFPWLQGVSSTIALLVASLILTTQRREDQLAGHRSQLILELAVVGDQKLSKVIELLEEVRRDNPAIPDRVDDQATAMSTPADTRAVLEAIKVVQDDIDGAPPGTLAASIDPDRPTTASGELTIVV
jgi:uncharacterized membrane protein